jgi:hypothetical protein
LSTILRDSDIKAARIVKVFSFDKEILFPLDMPWAYDPGAGLGR